MEASTQPAALESFNPATGERVGAVPVTDPARVQRVVDDVAEVQPFWAQLRLEDRARYMRRTAQVIIDQLDELTTLVTREQGRPRAEAYSMELVPTIDTLHWIADHGPKILADEKVRHMQRFFPMKRSFFSYEPLGVVGVVAPWNYPWSTPFGEVAMALMAGNGVVLQSAELTPLIGQRIQDVFDWAGLPDGIVRAVHGGDDVRRALLESTVSKVFSTGSVETGAQIVLADASLENAIAGCVWGGFANAGQTCSRIERVYVVRELADRFVEGVVEGAKALRVGDPSHWDVDVGPMVSEARYEVLGSLVEDALAAGAEMHCGGPVEPPRFYAPAVLTGVTPEMRIMREEVSGPVVSVVPVSSEEEAIALANDSEFAHGVSVWTLDRGKAERIARRLEARSVGINDHISSHDRIRSKFGFYECVNAKHVAWEPPRTRDFRWYPYDRSLGTALHSAAQLLYGRDEDKRAALKRGAGSFARVGRRIVGR